MREKKNRLALRVLSTAALMAMVSSIATAAFANTYYVDYGDINVNGSSVNYHDADGSNKTNEHDENIVITNNNKEESTSHTVTINAEEGSTAKVTLKDVNIDTSSKDEAAAAVTVTGNGTTSMELDGKNTLTSGGTHAGLEKNDAEGTGNLVIRDDTKDGGSLKATGGSEDYDGGAGIGSSCGNDTSKIEIAGGKVEAVGGQNAAGIGSGAGGGYGGGDAKQIKISGGDVTAVGKDDGAGIGGSKWGSTTDVSVKIGGSANPLKLVAKSRGSNEGTIGEGAVDDGRTDHGYNDDSVNFDEVQNMTADTLGEDGGILVELYNNYDPQTGTGTRYKCIHNRAYVGYPADADINEAHAWDEGVIVAQAAPGKPGTIRYTCTVDGCGATKEISYDYVEPGEKQLREVGVIFWDAANNAAAPEYLQGKVFSAEEQTTTAAKAQVESLLADKANWKLAENVGDLKIHPAADAAGTVYEQAVKASGCQYYVVANVTAQ